MAATLLHAAALTWQPLRPNAQGWKSTTVLRSAPPQALLPKALALIPILPWGVQIGYAIEQSAGLERGPFTRLVKSDAVQKGPSMRRMKKEPPKVRGVRLPAEAMAITQGFKKEYARSEYEVLWAALLKCYGGSKERALQAIESDPTVLNPSYAFANTLLESKRVIRLVMSEEEALEVMRLNPSVLTCGPSLDVLGAAEIKAFARLRSLGNTLVPPKARPAAVTAFIGSIILAAVTANGADETALLAGLRPLLGAGFASLFVFVFYGVVNSGRSVRDAEARR